MLEHLTIIEVAKPADKIYSFMLNLDGDKYRNWHPEHIDFRQINKTENIKGSIFYLNEEVEGTKVNYYWTVVEHKKNEVIKMKANYFYPIYLTLEFQSNSVDKTTVRHNIEIGFENKLISPIFDFLIRIIKFPQRVIKSLDRHATEEFKNLEKIL